MVEREVVGFFFGVWAWITSLGPTTPQAILNHSIQSGTALCSRLHS